VTRRKKTEPREKSEGAMQCVRNKTTEKATVRPSRLFLFPLRLHPAHDDEICRLPFQAADDLQSLFSSLLVASKWMFAEESESPAVVYPLPVSCC
jgi:hypothetical protein